MKNRNNPLLKRVLAVSLSVAVAVSFLPILGDAFAYADEQNGQESYYVLPENADDSGFVAEEDAMTKDEIKAEIKGQLQNKGPAKAAGIIDVEEDVGSIEAIDSDETLSNDTSIKQALFSDDKEAISVKAVDEADVEEGEEGEEVESSSYDVKDSGYQKVDCEGDQTYDPKTGIVTLNNDKILTQGVYSTSIYVDNDEVEYDANGAPIVIDEAIEIDGLTIDMKDYDVGLHTIWLVTGTSNSGVIYEDLCFVSVPTDIYDKPSLKLSDFYTGINYFDFENTNSGYDGVCIEYRKGSGGWSTPLGPVGYYDAKRKSGLAAASAYSARTYFYKDTSYYNPVTKQTEQYIALGAITGAYSNTVSFKTAYKATPVKSIKAKKVKQWCKKVKVRRLSSKVYWMNGYAGYGPYRKILGTKTSTYWYTKVKITVTMTKVPGIAGVYIGSKKVGGNKKTYAATFVLSGKKKGKKIAVSVYSYMNPTYVGLSGKTLRKVKVK